MKNFGMITLFLAFAGAANANNRVIYFGVYEVQAGALKSADGSLPRVGEIVTLAVDVNGLSTGVACNPRESNCASLNPRLFIRFNNYENFKEVTGLPKGSISERGPGTRFEYPGWESNQPVKVDMEIPFGASQIEAFIVFDRFHFTVSNCHLEYDTTVCSISNQELQGKAYVSNYGKNFKIGIVQ